MKIQRSVLRSEKAYELYTENKLYFQALRIYKANNIVYQLLQEFLFECEENHLEQVLYYIFHLEDWFESFEQLQNCNPKLDDTFVFDRLKGSPSFPGEFIKHVLND